YLRPEHILSVIPKPSSSSTTMAGAPQGTELASAALTLSSSSQLPPMREAREAFDRLYLEEVLRRSGGNVSAAAKRAGRNRTDFHELLRRHDINAAEFREASRKDAGAKEAEDVPHGARNGRSPPPGKR